MHAARHPCGGKTRVAPWPFSYGHDMGKASDSNEVRRLRYAFKRQGLHLRVQRATT